MRASALRAVSALLTPTRHDDALRALARRVPEVRRYLRNRHDPDAALAELIETGRHWRDVGQRNAIAVLFAAQRDSPAFARALASDTQVHEAVFKMFVWRGPEVIASLREIAEVIVFEGIGGRPSTKTVGKALGRLADRGFWTVGKGSPLMGGKNATKLSVVGLLPSLAEDQRHDVDLSVVTLAPATTAAVLAYEAGARQQHREERDAYFRARRAPIQPLLDENLLDTIPVDDLLGVNKASLGDVDSLGLARPCRSPADHVPSVRSKTTQILGDTPCILAGGLLHRC